MAALCPAPGANDPLVQSLLGTVDCNVDGLVRGGYGALFAPSGGFAVLMTSLLTIYVAVLGYQLLLGRTPLRIGTLAITALRIGVVLTLATGWSTYQTLVYNFLFHGPVELSRGLLAGVQPRGSLFRGDVFVGLQSVFDALNAFAADFAKNAATAATPASGAAPPTVGWNGGAGFGAQALTISAITLLFSTLGVVLAAKIILGLLLALGPIFIALMLFAATRGVFEGWLRATLAVAIAALASILTLGVALTVLEPSLLALRDTVAQNDYSLTPVYSILVLVVVFAAVSLGAVAAGGIIALGFRLPRGEGALAMAPAVIQAAPPSVMVGISRADRVAAAMTALGRREAALIGAGAAGGDRRTVMTIAERTSAGGRAHAPAPVEAAARLGQARRRAATPKARRDGSGAGR